MLRPFMERAADVACSSQIACEVLLSRANDDIEFIPLCPRLATDAELISRGEFEARGLRAVAVVGLNGLKPMTALKEPLEPQVVNAIAAAFLEYVRVLIGEQFTEQLTAAEVAELRRMYCLPDTRFEI